FDSKGGSLVSPIEVEVNQTITKPEDPTKEGYMFLGWYLNDQLFDFETSILSNITLEAKWEEIEEVEYVTITFETNGGSILEPREIQKGYVLTKPVDPTKDDLDFVGWSTSNDEFIEFDFETPITSNLTLYAFYGILNTYEVLIDGELYLVKEGKTIPTITPAFIEGKVFIGYLLDGESFDISTPIHENIILVSEYKDAFIFELTLELNGGQIEGDSVLTYYEYEDIMLKTPTKDGYIFIG